jgi:hypothetical protein
MERIPIDIIINHILPYTYNIQPKLILEDIQNYHKIKTILMDDKYDTDVVKHEILAVFYSNKQKLNNILHRLFLFGRCNPLHAPDVALCKKYDDDIIYKYSQNTTFNILFGLFSIEERTYFSEYILKDLRHWIFSPTRMNPLR